MYRLLEFYLDLDRCFRHDTVPGKQFSCYLDTYKISTEDWSVELATSSLAPVVP